MAEPSRGAPETCRTCEEPLFGPYCSACGESHRFPRLELRALLEDVLDGIANLDTRVLRTVGELTVDPARVGRDYLVGRRKPYVNPFKYALATFALAFAISQALISMHGVPSDPTAARAVEFSLNWGQAINFLVMPVFALCLYGLFYGPPRKSVFGAPRQLEWIEHYVLVLFALGHVALLQGLFAPFAPYVGGVVQLLVFVVVPIAYVSWMFVGVCRTSWWSTVPRVAVGFIAGMQVPAGLLARAIAPGLFAG
jgi:hypothetical protein